MTNKCCERGNWDRKVVNEFDVEVEFTDWMCHQCGANVQDMAEVADMMAR